MYQLHVTVHETIGAYICSAVISSTDQFGATQQFAAGEPAYLEIPEEHSEEDFTDLLLAAARYARILLDTPNK